MWIKMSMKSYDSNFMKSTDRNNKIDYNSAIKY